MCRGGRAVPLRVGEGAHLRGWASFRAFLVFPAMASECEKCKKTEFADKVTLKRCGKCKNVFYW